MYKIFSPKKLISQISRDDESLSTQPRLSRAALCCFRGWQRGGGGDMYFPLVVPFPSSPPLSRIPKSLLIWRTRRLLSDGYKQNLALVKTVNNLKIKCVLNVICNCWDKLIFRSIFQESRVKNHIISGRKVTGKFRSKNGLTDLK